LSKIIPLTRVIKTPTLPRFTGYTHFTLIAYILNHQFGSITMAS